MRTFSLPLKEDEKYIYIPCGCCCHDDGCHHIMPCCKDGFIPIKKGSEKHKEILNDLANNVRTQ